MAGNYDRDWICSARLSNGAGCLRPIYRLSDVQIRAGRSRWNREELIPYLALKVSSFEINRKRIIQVAAGNSFEDCLELGPKPAVISLDGGTREPGLKRLFNVGVGLTQTQGADPLVRCGQHYLAQRALANRVFDIHLLTSM